MKDRIRQHFLLIACLIMVTLAGCTTVPITGRSQFNVVPDSLINSMALQEYNNFLKSPETKLSTDAEKTAMVQRVGRRIARHRCARVSELPSPYPRSPVGWIV